MSMMAMSTVCCCKGRVGFDQFGWGRITSLTTETPVEHIADDISLLDDNIDALFAGNDFTCGPAIRFKAEDWPKIKSWIEAGGRMFIAAEHSGDFPGGNTFFKCLKDMPVLNDFLEAMGSSMRYVGQDYRIVTQGVAGAAKIAHPGEFIFDRFGEISGGTTVWLAPAGGDSSGRTVVAAEALGNGFLFVDGDSDSSGPAFFQRILNDADADIL